MTVTLKANWGGLNLLGKYGRVSFSCLKNKMHSISATETSQKHKSEITLNGPSASGIRHSTVSQTADRETICKACVRIINVHMTYQVNQSDKKNKSFTKQKNVNVIENSNYTSKFHKYILLNENNGKAFVDFGSECSLAKSSVVDNFNFQRYDLGNTITLSGFLGSGTTVTQYVRASTQIDSVVLNIEYYIVEDIEFKFDILIGRNFTENTSTVYYRIDDYLRFEYKIAMLLKMRGTIKYTSNSSMDTIVTGFLF
nr:unnamed protein product [Callosobruchus analis]